MRINSPSLALEFGGLVFFNYLCHYTLRFVSQAQVLSRVTRKSCVFRKSHSYGLYNSKKNLHITRILFEPDCVSREICVEFA